MLLIGLVMERGLIRFFYKRSHAEQILVTFGLAIVIQGIVKAAFGANPIPTPAPGAVAGSAGIGLWLGPGPGLSYPWWRCICPHFPTRAFTAGTQDERREGK